MKADDLLTWTLKEVAEILQNSNVLIWKESYFSCIFYGPVKTSKMECGRKIC